MPDDRDGVSDVRLPVFAVKVEMSGNSDSVAGLCLRADVRGAVDENLQGAIAYCDCPWGCRQHSPRQQERTSRGVVGQFQGRAVSQIRYTGCVRRGKRGRRKQKNGGQAIQSERILP